MHHCTLRDVFETFIQREHAERLIEEVRGDDPELASYLRIEERELALVVDSCPGRVGHRTSST